MKEFHTTLNRKLYYAISFGIILLMTFGLLISNPRIGNIKMGYTLHSVLLVLLALSILLYPRYETRPFRVVLIIVTTAYFYTLFFLYPDTWSTFIFLCFIPAISILLFDTKLFYFSLVLNGFLITLSFCYIYTVDQGARYYHIETDLVGNILNFAGSQAILYFIFHVTNMRIQKQRVYYEQVQNAERLKTTGQLAAAVAHEIRNPLTVVKGFLQYYEGNDDFKKEYKRNFSLMIDELDMAEHVISQFLSIAKPDKETRSSRIVVKSVLDDVTELLKTYGLLHDNHIELQVKEDCYVSANPIELKQLLINLIKNAIEASPHGANVLVKAVKRKGMVEIEVKDNGRGMSKEEISLLGTPFYSLKSKGTGLGLMICYNIVGKYNGTIEFSSDPGSGTTVTLQFPESS
ncbi:GHKL domain-containing protein [Bacillus salacetis]|uniref:histidine kinase n=2 Tax=Bacillus salacetis TaxID=2315464 RepID=A0A3A1QQS4_9BACI|nr:GHKL domain-containing protein [Bacillus salacetis]